MKSHRWRWLWGCMVLMFLGFTFWRCEPPAAPVDPDFRVCTTAEKDCSAGEDCVMNLCTRRNFQPLERAWPPEQPVITIDASEVTPEKICPPELPNCTLCSSKTDCTDVLGKGWFCDLSQGVCVEGCENNDDCSEQATDKLCDLQNKRCRACLMTSQCPSGKICRDYTCQDCQDDTECSAGQLCLGGACQVAACRADADCVGKTPCTDDCLCIQNTCRPCVRDQECSSGQLCEQGRCIAGTCRTDTKPCPGGLLCVQFQCVPCQRDADCRSGEICKVCPSGQTEGCGFCTPDQCSTRADCPEGLICDAASKCVPCQSRADCTNGVEVCAGGFCRTGNCTGDGECTGTLPLCLNFICSPCQRDGQCLAGTFCVNGICQECRQNTDCDLGGKGRVCKNNRCTNCSTQSDCLTGEFCSQGLCVVGECVVNSDCSNRLICKNNQCVPCSADADCGSGARCLSQVCVLTPVLSSGAYQWSNGSFATDCANYRFPPEGYQAATTDGLYRIKPNSQTPEFSVYCNMTYAGGGWTLVLKADGGQANFIYSSALWENGDTFPASNPDPDFNRTQAKLRSYMTVPLDQVLLQMQQNNNEPVRSGIMEVPNGASSFRALMTMQNPSNNTMTGSLVWRSLVPNSSIQSTCRSVGIRLSQSGGDVVGVRLGILADNSSGCGSPDSFIGFGGERSGSTKTPSVGNYARWFPDNGDQTTAMFGYLWVRRLPSARINLQFHDGAFRYPDGSAAENCLAYRLPPASLRTNGAYWIKPKANEPAYKAYCLMDLQGGGWTLAAKVDGRNTTFSYSSNRWTDSTTLNTNSLALSREEAKFASFSNHPFSQLLLGFITPADGNPVYIPLLIHASGNSLREVFAGSNNQLFSYPLDTYIWREVVGGGSLQTRCIQEGFNLNPNGGDHAKARVGVVGDNDSNCRSYDSRIGVGTSGDSCSASNSNSAGNEARGCSNSPSGSYSRRSFVFMFVR